MSVITREEPGVLIAVPERMPIHEAARTMAEKLTGAVLVVDAEHQPIGLLTERDLVRRVVAADKLPSSLVCSDVMTRPALTVNEGEASVDDVLQLMVQNNTRHVALVDEAGAPVGLLSLQRLLRHKLRDMEMENHTLFQMVGCDGIGG